MIDRSTPMQQHSSNAVVSYGISQSLAKRVKKFHGKMSAMLIPRKASCRAGTVSLIFAISLIPMLMLVGLAIDFGFYTEAQSQLDAAADASAMHAVRIAVQVYENENQGTAQANTTDALNKGQAAGMVWFAAQEADVPQAQGTITPTIQMAFDSSTNQISAKVSYVGVIRTQFAAIFPGTWPEYPNWGISGAATAVISTLTYSEFDFLVVYSSSMLIAASPADIQTMEGITPCSTQATSVQTITNQPLLGAYSWYYDPNGALDNNSTVSPPDAPGTLIPYGYGIFSYRATTGANKGTVEQINDIPLPAQPIGECDPAFYTDAVSGGYSGECFYVPGQTASVPLPVLNPPLNPTTGLCNANAKGVVGGGVGQQINPQTQQVVNISGIPQAPCAFACHTDTSSQTDATQFNDYYGLARQNNVTLRFDVIQNALTAQTAQNGAPIGVIPTLESYVQNAGNLNPVTVGVYYFSGGVTNPVVAAPTSNSLTALQNAETTELAIQPTAGPDQADTNTPFALTTLYNTYSKAGQVGTGNLPSAPKKYLFLITDGMEDYTNYAGTRVQGPLGTIVQADGSTSLTECTAIKALGVKIYVLYTTYYPLPNPFYLANDAQYAQPTGTSSPIYQALAQCASPSTPGYPTILEATDQSDIGTALNTLVQSALSAPGRLQN